MLSLFEYVYVFVCIVISFIVLNQVSPNNSMGSFSNSGEKKIKFDTFMKFSIFLIIFYIFGALYINYTNKYDYQEYFEKKEVTIEVEK